MCVFGLRHHIWFSPDQLPLQSYNRRRLIVAPGIFYYQWSGQLSCPLLQFSILLPGCTDSLASWLSSLCTERLANNLSAPVGYEANMSTTGPVFLKPAMKIREWGWSGHSAGKEEGEQRGKEGQRKQGRASRFPDFHYERECSSDSVLQQSQSLGTDIMALLAHYHCQPQCINAGTRAENVFRSIYFFTSACTWCSPDAKNTL